MNYGFVATAAVTPKIKVADVTHNGAEIEKYMRKASECNTGITVFPELCLTGATCGDVFKQELLLTAAKEELLRLVKVSEELSGLMIVGLPWEVRNKLYNAAAVFESGQLLGIVPKTYLKDTGVFTAGKPGYEYVDVNGEMIPFGTSLLFTCENDKNLTVAVEIGEDLWAPNPKSTAHALMGATIIAGLAACDEGTGKREYRKQLIANQSARLHCAYVYANAGEGESTTDFVFSGTNVIAENGTILSEACPYDTGMLGNHVDVELLSGERRRNPLFATGNPVDADYLEVDFGLEESKYVVFTNRAFDQSPFVPKGRKEWEERCEEILAMQVNALKKRLEHTWCSNAVLGISGGLDSTLALLVTALAFDRLGKDRSCITAVTMPCFGTTDRTYNNACELTRRLGAKLREVDIKNAVRGHFADIGHDENVHDVT